MDAERSKDGSQSNAERRKVASKSMQSAAKWHQIDAVLRQHDTGRQHYAGRKHYAGRPPHSYRHMAGVMYIQQ